MKRTINEIYRDRLVAEADEADNMRLTKLAENITRQIERQPVREANESYTYPVEAFEQDVQDALWDVVVRTADFHGSFISSQTAQEIVEHFSQEMINNIRKAAKITSPVGAYEPRLPGEELASAVIEVEEE